MGFLLRRARGKCVCEREMADVLKGNVYLLFLQAQTLKSGLQLTQQTSTSVLAGAWVCACQLNKVFESLSRQVNIWILRLGNFITLICHDVSHNVSQTISCMVAGYKNHWFWLKQPIFQKACFDLTFLLFPMLGSGSSATLTGKLF